MHDKRWLEKVGMLEKRFLPVNERALRDGQKDDTTLGIIKPEFYLL